MPHFKDLLSNNSNQLSDGKKHIEKIICAPEVIDVTMCKHSNSSSEEMERLNLSNNTMEEKEKEKARIQ